MITFNDAFLYEVGSSKILPMLAHGDFLTTLITKYYVWKTKRKMKSYEQFVSFKEKFDKTISYEK